MARAQDDWHPRGLARSVVAIAALTLDEVLDGGEAATIRLGPWRRRCRRLVRRALDAY